MTTFILLILAGVCAGIYFWSKKQSEPVNRYRHSKTILPSHHPVDVLVDTVLEVKEMKSMSSHPTPDCVIVLYLMASDGAVYSGYELLQALLSAGLRYGKQHIFHRHHHKDGRGEILFHCASATTPGTFDLTKIGAFSCKGLSLFVSAASISEPLAAFDCLLETIDQLVEDLGGKVLDDQRVLLTKERMVKYRQQIRAYETGKTTADMFA